MGKSFEKIMIKVSSIFGKVVLTIFTSARKAFKTVLDTIIPFLVFVTTMFTLITKTGIGQVIANGLSDLASSPMGLIVLALTITFPLISPIVGPGAVIQQTIGALIGGLIAQGSVPLSMALPAVFAVHQPSGADFIPVGMSLCEAEPETVEIGVPAVLYSKFIVAPIEVGLAVIVGMLLF